MIRFLLIPIVFTVAFANAETKTYQSPNGRTEECVALPPLPGAELSKKDLEKEKELCDINFYAEDLALCPKNNSTSAAIKIYDISEVKMSVENYEKNQCENGDGDKIAKFKTTMWQSGTSGTTSISSLLYYQFSRYLDTLVDVPVAVYRTIDKDVFFNRVMVQARGQSQMNRTAWDILKRTVTNPSAYNPPDDVLTKDRMQFYGSMLNNKGERYGAEINSHRKAGWGAPQYKEFQTTPAFTALRNPKPLNEAIAGAPYPAAQMVFWMRELSEIVILDYIFSQQDRVGNVDYVWEWYWVQDGQVMHKKVKSKVPRANMQSIAVPEEIKAFNPVLLQRTQLNDNDASATVPAANFSKQSGAVEGLRHLNGGQYKKLMDLARDFKTNGPIATQLKGYTMAPGLFNMIAKNSILVAEILEKNCRANLLRFDLTPSRFLKGEPTEAQVSCDGN